MSAHTYVVGNLGNQPEARFTQSGNATLTFSVGCTPRRKDKDSGQWDDDGSPLWITITLWGEDAERWAEVLDKGDRISVNGTLKRRTYERREGGQGESLELVGARDLAIVPKAGDREQPPRRDSGRGEKWTPPGRESVSDPWAAQKPLDEPPPF